MPYRIISCVTLALAVTAVPVFGQDGAKKDEEFKTAVQNGVNFLKRVHRNQIGYNGGSNGVGTAGLAGLALLESGVPVDDPSVAVITAYIRQNALSQTGTYQVSICIMFLDRLGSKGDVGLIQFLTLRLLSGQTSGGMWSYVCDGFPVSGADYEKLRRLFVQQTRLSTPGAGAKEVPPPKAKEVPKPREDLDPDPSRPPAKKAEPKPKDKDREPTKTDPAFQGIHPELRGLAKMIAEGGSAEQPLNRILGGDHSNTQFATVALWCGRRHSVNVGPALAKLEKHYRDCQNGDGGWGYSGGGDESTPAMTCAGLMGLAMGFGARDDKLTTRPGGAKGPLEVRDPGADKAIERGLKRIGDELAKAEQGEIRRGRRGFLAKDGNSNHYLLWSVERVAMVYGLATIGKVDWYAWGADALLQTQSPDGSWPGNGYHGASPDLNTSFALLFLGRANLASDLSASLKGRVRDPGTSKLVGGDITKINPGGSTGGNPGTTVPKPKNDPVTKIDPLPMVSPKDPPKVDPPVKPPVRPPVDGGDFETKAARLTSSLVGAGIGEFEALLERYRDTKGAEYTEALARSALKLNAGALEQVREALAARLRRMTAATLAEMMRDPNRELRRAAAQAASTKTDQSLLGELVRLLGDDDSGVVQHARGSLKTLTGQDFGPEAKSLPAERAKAIREWRAWLENRKK